MNVENLYIAEVINNDDSSNTFSPGVEGRVQIYVETFMSGWNQEDYPWARPFSGDGSNSHGQIDIPTTGDKIWVFCEKPELKKNWYYLSGVSLKKMNIFQKAIIFLKGKFKLSILTGGLNLKSSHPDIQLTYYPNGIVIGVSKSSTTPEVFIYHPSGSSVSINGDGDINSKGDWKHYGNFKVTESIVAKCDTTNIIVEEHDHISASPGGKTSPPNPGV